ncbi:MAG: TolC family protein [Acidobacteria bacterium]|nr:TolC family protein [Acidobacteriota bacterium]
MTRLLLAALAVQAAVAAAASAQVAPRPAAPDAQVFTLQDALHYAVEHYPAIAAALEQVNASAASVSVARSAYLPRLDSVLQVNRATVNNVTGLLLPQSVVPGISGPPLPSGSSQSAWGSAAGALFSWEPFDFGLRDAGVRGAEAAVTRARANQSLTRLEVQSAVGAAFLAVVQAEQAVTATVADVERRTVLARAARALADNDLRPGAEASRADAERAAAETRAILARQSLALAQTTFARVLGVTSGPVGVNAGSLLAPAPPTSPPAETASAHPLALASQASVDEARTQEEILARTNRPRLYVQSALFARGSGAAFNGSFDGGADGLGLERANWAAGVQVVMPNLFDVASLRARRAASAATTRAEAARYDEALLMVTSQQQAAAVMVEAARAVAATTPVQLAAARQSESQASARYQAGLASIVEVADTQGLLAQAEYQDGVARVDVWRALLADAVAHGDLGPFVSLLSPGGR